MNEDYELMHTDEDEDVYTPAKLLGVATLGAVLSLGVYYLYNQMDEEKRASLRRKASNLVADQITRLTEVEEY